MILLPTITINYIFLQPILDYFHQFTNVLDLFFLFVCLFCSNIAGSQGVPAKRIANMSHPPISNSAYAYENTAAFPPPRHNSSESVQSAGNSSTLSKR